MLVTVVIIIIGVVAYWHYTQGFFSSTISAILAVLAAVFAIGWHEKLTDMLLKGRFADYAYAITLVAIFVLVYSLGRYAFDTLVPGNLRFPAIVDKIGAGAMGVIAGIACAGVSLIAIQTLPFSETILGWDRYEVVEKNAAVVREGSYQQVDAIFTELTAEKFLNDQPNSLLVPADEWMLGLVTLLSSADGSLSTGRPWTTIHPNYPQELFGQRVSQLPGARHCALADKISLVDVCTEDTFGQFDQERAVNQAGISLGTRGKKRIDSGEVKKLDEVRKAGASTVFLVVRVTIDQDNRDLKTNVITFPAAAARLCIPVANDPTGRLAANYFPIGTLDALRRLYVALPDDVLFAQPNKIADFVYEVPRSALLTDAKGTRLVDGAFFEFKRLAREDLGGRQVKQLIRSGPQGESAFLRKGGGATPETPANTSPSRTNTPTPSAVNANVPLIIVEGSVVPNGQLPNGINVGTPNPKVKDEIAAWGSFSLDEGKFVDIELTAVQTVQLMGKGPNQVNMLGAPQGKRAIIVWTRNREDVQDKWAWANTLNDFTYADSGGTRHALSGVIVKLKDANGRDMLNITFNSTKQSPLKYGPDKDALQMRPTDVGLIFVVPQGAQLANLMFKTEVAKNLPVTVN